MQVWTAPLGQQGEEGRRGARKTLDQSWIQEEEPSQALSNNEERNV